MRTAIANVRFDPVTMAEAVARITQMAQKTDRARLVCTGNLDHLVLLARDPEFAAIYGGADLVLADGAPVVWLSRLAARRGQRALPERVAGSDLFWELARASERTGLRLFFLGGRPGAAAAAADAVHARHPAAVVCGAYCPPAETFATEAEQSRIHALLAEAQPDVLLVGLGAPKQEKWVTANRDRLGAVVCVGVGGTFEMAAGRVRRAPRWMQRVGLEWAYRLGQEPSRLWRRYLLHDLPFLAALAWQTLRARPATPGTPAGSPRAPEAEPEERVLTADAGGVA